MPSVSVGVVKNLLLLLLLLVGCSAAVPAPVASGSDAKRWNELGDWLCSRTGGVEYTGDEVSLGLPGAVFFDAKDTHLKAQVKPWLDRIIATLHDLPRGAKLVVTLTVEDEATTLVERDHLARERSAAITTALTQAGLARADFTIRAPTTRWEGDFDGPAALDPAGGRVTFAIER